MKHAPLLEIEMAQETAANAESSQEVEECVTGMDLSVYKAAATGNRIDNDLLSHGESLSQKLTPTKNTVLHICIACAKNTSDTNAIVMKILTKCAALLFQPNEQGDTPLHIAARLGHDAIADQLINAACPDQQLLIAAVNHDGDTALHEAVRFNHHAVVTKLTRAGPEVFYSANDAGETPLYMAAEMGYNDIVSEILGTCSNPAYDGPDGRTALHAAVFFNDDQMMNKLLEHYGGNDDRALTTAVDKVGWTPLHYAASQGYSSIVKQLLGPNRCAAYVRDKIDKKTALHIAASGGHLDVIKELISHCPDCCEVVDKRRRNILHYAIENKNFQIQEFVRKDPWLSNVLLYGKDEDRTIPFFHQLAASSSEIVDYIESIDPPSIMTSSGDFICDIRVNTDNNVTNKFQDTSTNSKKNELRQGEQIEEGNEVEKEGQRIESAAEKLKQAQLKPEEGWESVRQELQQANLIVVTLITAVTFTAGMTAPGGFESEGPHRGLAVLRNDQFFFLFSWFNTLAVIFSSLSVLLHFLWIPYRPCKIFSWAILPFLTLHALIFMVFGFISGTYAILGVSLANHVWVFAVITCAVVIFLAYGRRTLTYQRYCCDPSPYLRHSPI